MGLGMRIRQLRRERDMTQAALGMAAGLSRVRINEIERKPDASIKLETLSRIADALGMSRSELLDGTVPTAEAVA